MLESPADDTVYLAKPSDAVYNTARMPVSGRDILRAPGRYEILLDLGMSYCRMVSSRAGGFYCTGRPLK